MPAMAAESVLHHPHVQALYSDHHGWLQGWLRKKLGNAFDAADLAQDTFVRVLRAPGLDRVEEPRAYLTTVARNLLINHVRRRAIERAWQCVRNSSVGQCSFPGKYARIGGRIILIGSAQTSPAKSS